MCFPKQKKLPKPTAEPEKPADPPEVGEARKAEDEQLFGGVPDLRTDRSALEGGAGAGGSGLGQM